MTKNRLTHSLLASFVTIILGSISLLSTPALAASAGNQVQYGTGNVFGRTGVRQVVMSSSLPRTGGYANAGTWRSVPVRFSVSTPGSPILQTVSPASTPKSGPAPVSNPGTSSGISTDEQQAFSLINADRAAKGLPNLRLSAQLTSLAQYYAQDMINRGFFSHNNPEGQSPFDRMRQQGISYGYAGENLAINSGVSSAENAFMNSPGHRANILSTHYTQVGVGVRHGSNGSTYVVQEFTDG